MPEAVIVSTARTPIGRAMKGSLKDLRPDDLTALIVDAVLNKVPALDRNRSRTSSWAAASPPVSPATTSPASSPSWPACPTSPA